jgi:hypothetical protein
MATFLKLGRELTLPILAVLPVDHENERAGSREARCVGPPEAQEKVLSQQAEVQTLPGGTAQGSQGRTQRYPGSRARKGLQKSQKILRFPSYLFRATFSELPLRYPSGSDMA